MRTLLVVLVATLTTGCGAKFATTDDDGGAGDGGSTGDGGGGSDGGVGGDGGSWSPVCPAALPAVGSACTTAGVTCEYGTSVYTSCNSIVTCSRGSWSTTTYPEGDCPTGPRPAICPATFASVQRGGACAPQGTQCAYPEGACLCDIPFFGPPQPVDGGGPLPTWHCDDPGPGCPVPRPRVGSACTVSSNLSCMYRDCAFGEQCIDGYWQGEQVACANAGGAGGAP